MSSLKKYGIKGHLRQNFLQLRSVLTEQLGTIRNKSKKLTAKILQHSVSISMYQISNYNYKNKGLSGKLNQEHDSVAGAAHLRFSLCGPAYTGSMTAAL